jgi:carbon storage regulator
VLVIRRHPGETLHIGGEVELVVIDCGPGRVKLGIRAPQHVPVVRGEVKSTREQNIVAALPPGRELASLGTQLRLAVQASSQGIDKS